LFPTIKTTFCGLIICTILFGAVAAPDAAEESLGAKIKKTFEPTPTPTPTRKRRKHLAKEPVPSASATASPHNKKASATAPPSATPKNKSRRKEPFSTPVPTASSSATVAPAETPSLSPTETGLPSATPWEALHSTPAKNIGLNVTLSPDKVAGYDDYSPKVRRIIEAGLELTKQNLGYTYGSADPTNGGMDCSGFVYYVLRKNGFPDVPRDSSQQYVWVRKAGNFNAVLSRREDSFELDALKPGDLLFWRGTYNIDRDPPVTHTMIYLGREKRTKKRVMLGASDGRTYDGKQIFGVSVFDFKLPAPSQSGDAKLSPMFVGYGRIPGLIEE